jgi:hypothetical protein
MQNGGWRHLRLRWISHTRTILLGFPWGFYTTDASRTIGKKSGNAAALDGWQEFVNGLVAAEMTWNRP